MSYGLGTKGQVLSRLHWTCIKSYVMTLNVLWIQLLRFPPLWFSCFCCAPLTIKEERFSISRRVVSISVREGHRDYLAKQTHNMEMLVVFGPPIILLLVCFFIYQWRTYKTQFWKRRGVAQEETISVGLKHFFSPRYILTFFFLGNPLAWKQFQLSGWFHLERAHFPWCAEESVQQE